MKWIVVALSALTVSLWGVVLYLSFQTGEDSHLSTAAEGRVQPLQVKASISVIDGKFPPDEKVDPIDEQEQQSSLEDVVNQISDDDMVGIDELLSALDIAYE
ncbi:hypothetical protein SH601_16180 [Gracilibacillus sp. S3-1-1]|uniref:Uncharacterized protein n=1 Tax=Gracilibacillus pellucidus TaxID=3095368 RepID=A0ACC6M9E9_9BACI|nr:hypothetical protein [Gracilibacillus sp. S3-1-1]MDX8047506.1 hypothetical protein [Gracilibacillus sp. S3-1-1]